MNGGGKREEKRGRREEGGGISGHKMTDLNCNTSKYCLVKSTF